MRVLLVPNPSNPRSIDAVRAVVGRLESEGYEPTLARDDALACGVEGYGVSRSELGAPGLVLAFGGDGTILKAVHLLAGHDAPILGVNLGQLGFLSGADGSRLDDVVSAALAGDAHIERRATLDADVRVGGRDAGSYQALNEVFVGRAGGSRVVELEVVVNDVRVCRYVCDGVVVATPTGSTAYALSAGGPLIAPDVRGIAVVPVAPHTLTARSLVLGPADSVTIRCPNPSRAEACVSVDGEQVPCRTTLDSVRVALGSREVRLMRLDGRGFYEALADTFFGG